MEDPNFPSTPQEPEPIPSNPQADAAFASLKEVKGLFADAVRDAIRTGVVQPVAADETEDDLFYNGRAFTGYKDGDRFVMFLPTGCIRAPDGSPVSITAGSGCQLSTETRTITKGGSTESYVRRTLVFSAGGDATEFKVVFLIESPNSNSVEFCVTSTGENSASAKIEEAAKLYFASENAQVLAVVYPGKDRVIPQTGCPVYTQWYRYNSTVFPQIPFPVKVLPGSKISVTCRNNLPVKNSIRFSDSMEFIHAYERTAGQSPLADFDRTFLPNKYTFDTKSRALQIPIKTAGYASGDDAVLCMVWFSENPGGRAYYTVCLDKDLDSVREKIANQFKVMCSVAELLRLPYRSMDPSELSDPVREGSTAFVVAGVTRTVYGLCGADLSLNPSERSRKYVQGLDAALSLYLGFLHFFARESFDYPMYYPTATRAQVLKELETCIINNEFTIFSLIAHGEFDYSNQTTGVLLSDGSILTNSDIANTLASVSVKVQTSKVRRKLLFIIDACFAGNFTESFSQVTGISIACLSASDQHTRAYSKNAAFLILDGKKVKLQVVGSASFLANNVYTVAAGREDMWWAAHSIAEFLNTVVNEIKKDYESGDCTYYTTNASGEKTRHTDKGTASFSSPSDSFWLEPLGH